MDSAWQNPTPLTPPASPNAPGGGSTTLVVVAVIVAVLAVVLVNVYIELVRRQSQPEEFTVYRLTQQVRDGDVISEKLVEAFPVDKRFEDGFGDAATEEAIYNAIQTRKPFTQRAERGQVVTFDMLRKTQSQREEYQPDVGKVDVALTVDSNQLPALFEGMTVDAVAPFMVQGQVRYIPVLQGVVVKQLGDPARDEGDDGPVGRYKKVILELLPEQALTLENIKQRAVGKFVLFRRNSGDTGRAYFEVMGLNPDLPGMLDAPDAAAAGGV